jgi:signal recognition particle subunit SRP72
MEKIDIPATYSDLFDAIKNEEHENVLSFSEKILKTDPKDKEAFQCKIISLINLSKNDDIISLIEKNSLQKEFLLEYAYALHEKKKYNESIEILKQHSSSRKEIINNINELLAQNYYKIGNFKDSYRIYKEIVQGNMNNLEEEKDLVSNFLASYILSDAKDDSILNSITKYLDSWESFFNYCVICIKEGKLNESMETLFRMRRDYPQLDDEYNECKSLELNLNFIAVSFEGFDYSKFTNILDNYEKFFSKNKFNELFPYFYNNLIYVKKDKESLNEILRKFDNLLKMDTLTNEEKKVLTINKIILLIRANRLTEALELFKSINPSFEDPIYLIINCYIYYKQEKIEKLEELLRNDKQLKDKPVVHLIIIQLMLSTINSKNIENFHQKVLSFVKQFYDFTLNFHFLNFFIGFYESRHLKDYLSQFVFNYTDINKIANRMKGKDKYLKNSLALLGHAFYNAGMYEDSVRCYSYIIDNVDKYDKDVKLNLINSLSHVDIIKCDEIRRQLDETMIDLSMDHISNLMNEVIFKFKKNQNEKINKKNKKKKKIRYPKNFDPKKPGPLPDPERWLPKLQRKKYRNIAKNKMSYQGAVTDNTTTTSQFAKK